MAYSGAQVRAWLDQKSRQPDGQMVCWNHPGLDRKLLEKRQLISGWWFQIFYIFTPAWGNGPI